MRHVIQRLGVRLTRGWSIILLVIVILTGAALWVGPLRPLPADLRLVALGADGRFHETVEIPANLADTTQDEPGVSARLPVVLAVYNNGARDAVPIRLSLSVPRRFRLASSAGKPYPTRSTAGNPLVQYVFDIEPGRVRPKHLPRVLSSLDTLWLEAVLPSYYCTLLDSIPEFVPTPPQDPNVLAQLRIFYSFEARTRSRQAGVLTMQIEPILLRHTPAPTPPVFPTRMREPEFPLPALGVLRQVGSRATQCGDLGANITLNSVLWETPEGGRFFVVHQGNKPRKYLFDLNRDSIIEFEMWDPDRDGKFEAARQARMVIPEFLMPPRVVLATLDTAMLTDSMGVGTAHADTVARALPVPELDYAFPPAVFRDTGAGPFRFWRALQNDRAQVAQPESTPAAPGRPAPERRAPGTPPASDTAPRLLGRPLPGAPPARRDTIRRDTLRSFE